MLLNHCVETHNRTCKKHRVRFRALDRASAESGVEWRPVRSRLRVNIELMPQMWLVATGCLDLDTPERGSQAVFWRFQPESRTSAALLNVWSDNKDDSIDSLETMLV